MCNYVCTRKYVFSLVSCLPNANDLFQTVQRIYVPVVMLSSLLWHTTKSQQSDCTRFLCFPPFNLFSVGAAFVLLPNLRAMNCNSQHETYFSIPLEWWALNCPWIEIHKRLLFVIFCKQIGHTKLNCRFRQNLITT